MTGTAALNGPIWGARAREWADYQEAGAAPLYEAVLGHLDVGSETALLDVGCGAGMVCALAGERGATVAGLDAAEGLLAIARERSPGGDFRLGELEQLPWEDGSFDAVTGFNSFQFASDPVNALREARRVARPEGGRVSIAVWGDPADCEAVAALKAVGDLLPAPPPGTPGPYALSDPQTLEAIVVQAGLEPEEIHDVPCPWVYPDLDAAVRGLGASGPAVRAEQEVGREAVEQALARSLQPHLDVATGIVSLENVFRFLIARR
jgi:SAM-dependent methyltransferase